MTEIDIICAALCIWKEARNDLDGMRGVMNVLLNRAKRNSDSVYAEVFKPLQFSSMSYQHDPQLLRQPNPNHPEEWQAWLNAKTVATSASTGVFEDNTAGATSYYSTTMDDNPPSWGRKMVPTVVIGGQRFFRTA
jgi:spore germination cell wall hydrolase CwlJ-like protein